MTKDFENLKTAEEAEIAYRFEPGISLVGDMEGLKITNYQIAGEHAAKRIKDVIGEKPILEVCAGIGATTFVLARFFPKVYAVEKDIRRLQICKENINRLGLGAKVEFINGDILNSDILKHLSTLGIGAVYTDVDWTTSDDWRDHVFDINATDPSTKELYEKLTKFVSENICMKLPKTINTDQFRGLDRCEVESVCPDEKLSFYLVYFGKLTRQESNIFNFPKNNYERQ